MTIDIKTLVQNASNIIAPLWPLNTFIARNPLLHLESSEFEATVRSVESILKSRQDANPVNREMIKWCAAFLDQGQASISMPGRENGFYKAWASLAPYDKSLKSISWITSLPPNSAEAISLCLKELKIEDDEIEPYLMGQLAELPGWAGYIKWLEAWKNEQERNQIDLIDFLAVRLILNCAYKPASRPSPAKDSTEGFFTSLHEREENYLSSLVSKISPHIKPVLGQERPDAQLVFCIDVRSEPFRARLEKIGHYETFGFAGFFGLPVSIHSFNENKARSCCPVLLKPAYNVFEEPATAEKSRISTHKRGKRLLNGACRFYADLKYNFGTPFALVETLGLWYGLWMSFRTLLPHKSNSLRQALRESIKPSLKTTPRIEMPLENQIAYGETALRMMGLTRNFSRLVVFCGHRSQTENNPYASALDCGACGGNPGGQNGRILSAILNSPSVRSALGKRGILIPEDTFFIGGEHNTTTDEVQLDEEVPKTHTELLMRIKSDLNKTQLLNCEFRSKRLGAKGPCEIMKRSADWSETRPEWGLAKNAAFIAGPRSLTKNLDLEGRCFLHSYEWKDDENGNFLETILTAPMVVAEWINTQYFFSTLDNALFGSGSKITHNITGKIGIMQGNASDLMQGLPLQSVNIADEEAYHDLQRLQVIVNAPRIRIDQIIDKHSALKNLLLNRWVILVAIDPTDTKFYRFKEIGEWQEINRLQGSVR